MILQLPKLEIKREHWIFLTKILIFCLISIPLAGDNNKPLGLKIGDDPLDRQTLALQMEGLHSSIPMSHELWQYLRAGLNYLETSGKNYPPDFAHPGGQAYGSLGLTRIAVMDVIQNYPALAKFTPDKVFTETAAYEEAARNYADLLLRHYLGMDYCNLPEEQVFTVLQRAWFLGPNLYKNGGQVLISRERRAQEYLLKIANAFGQTPAVRFP